MKYAPKLRNSIKAQSLVSRQLASSFPTPKNSNQNAPKLTLLCTVTLSQLSLYLGLFKIQLADPLEIHKWPPFSLGLFCFSLYMYIHAAAAAAAAKSLQSCPTLCNPVDGSPPGFPIPRSLQARTLEWVAISFSNA